MLLNPVFLEDDQVAHKLADQIIRELFKPVIDAPAQFRDDGTFFGYTFVSPSLAAC
jgi:hypothetical protein